LGGGVVEALISRGIEPPGQQVGTPAQPPLKRADMTLKSRRGHPVASRHWALRRR
jgi:hypothetical protein